MSSRISSSGGGGSAAKNSGGQPKEDWIGGEVVFDQFTDTRPLNYKYLVSNKTTGIKTD
jgi:hypothetical protein